MQKSDCAGAHAAVSPLFVMETTQGYLVSVLMLVSVLLRSGVCTSFPLNLSGFNECFVMYNMAEVILSVFWAKASRGCSHYFLCVGTLAAC